jgi:hypothetical protein
MLDLDLIIWLLYDCHMLFLIKYYSGFACYGEMNIMW